MPPIKDCVICFWETKVKCVRNSYHSFSDDDINYNPIMKTIQSFHVIRFVQFVHYFFYIILIFVFNAIV